MKIEIILEIPDACPHCQESDAPGTPPGGDWWWTEKIRNGKIESVYCRHCKYEYPPPREWIEKQIVLRIAKKLKSTTGKFQMARNAVAEWIEEEGWK